MKRGLDTQLGKISMYRLMSIALTVLWLMSLLASFAGLLTYSPLAILLSALVFTLAAFLANRLFGLLFGVYTHDESSYITAMILFFIFTPSVGISSLMTLALVAMIASGSKYLLAVRGRHIFNPAAIAAVAVGLLGLGHASWWVANPVLLPMTMLLTFLILYRTGRQAAGSLFLAIAVPIIAGRYLVDGQTLSEAVGALPSWPMLFLVGFMLTEPLTLPPRHRQQLLIGALIAVLFALPLQFGEWSITPEIALTIGNVVAFMFVQKSAIALKLTAKRRLTPTTDELVFTPNRPVTFLPGQFMEITVPHKGKDSRGLRRMFSIASAPGEDTVRFGIKFYDKSSTFKQTLRAMEPGMTIHATHISGDFVLPEDPKIPLLFIAGGIGITPFISHLVHLKKTDESRDIILIYAVSSMDEIAYVDILVSSEIRVIVATDAKGTLPDNSWKLVNNSRLTGQDIQDAVDDAKSRQIYIAGPPSMVDGVGSDLKALGVSRIKKDYFTGY